MRLLRGLLYYLGGFFLVFTLVRLLVWKLPGTVADVLSDSETNLIDLQNLSQINAAQGGYFRQLWNFVTLDWGQSLAYKENNLSLVLRHFRVTFALSLLSVFFSLAILLLLFYWKKSLARRVSNFLLAVPGLALFPLTVFILCSFSSYCPAGSSRIKLMIAVAAFAQALLSAPRFFRELDWEIENTLRQRFVLVLRAKGLSRSKILWMHVLTNVFPPFLSLLLLSWLGFLSGSILIEALFDLPGIGALTLEALRARDLPLVHALVMLLSLLHLSSLQLSRALRKRVYD